MIASANASILRHALVTKTSRNLVTRLANVNVKTSL
jgi:hypothetical protein